MINKIRAFKGIFLIAVILFFCSSSYGAQAENSRELLEGRIDSLRNEAEFKEALPLARELAGLIKADQASASYEINDAGLQIETLEFIVSLPDSTRKKLVYADNISDQYFGLYAEGAYEEALEKATEQLEIRKRIYQGDHPEIAESMNNRGFLLAALERFQEAENMYNSALAMDRRVHGEMHPDVATDYNNLGGLMHNLHRLDEAESFYRRACNIYKKLEGDETPNVAMCLSNIASVYKDRGNFIEAEPLFRKALLIYRKEYGNVDEDVAYALHNLATFLIDKGDIIQAEPLFREAVDIYRKMDKDEYELSLGITLNGLASLLQDREKYPSAEEHYREALKICKKLLGEEHRYVLNIQSNLADLYHDRGDYEIADSIFNQVLNVRRKLHSGYHKSIAVIKLNLARNKRDMGDYSGSIPEYLEALSIFKETLGESHPYTAMCLYSYGNCLIAQGKFTEAAGVLRNAVDVYEASRARMETGIERAEFQNSPYPKLARTYLATDEPIKAWEAIESDQGRILAELIMQSDKRQLTIAEEAREDSLKKELISKERKLSALRGNADSSPGKINKQIEQARNELLNTETEWHTFQKEMAGKYPVSRGVSYPLSRIQKSIPEKTALIGWLDVEEKKGEYTSWVYVIRNKGEVKWDRCPEPEDDDPFNPFVTTEVFKSAVSYRYSSQRGRRHDSRKIYDSRFAGIIEYLNGIEHLVVIPSGAILGVPVEALTDTDGKYLCDRYTISYVPSATIYSWLEERKESRQETEYSTLLVGDPVFDDDQAEAGVSGEGALSSEEKVIEKDRERSVMLRRVLDGERNALNKLERLTASRREVKRISEIAPRPTLLVGKDAAEARLVQLNREGFMDDFSFIHIATHALIDDMRPHRSSLVLSQAGLKDPLESVLRKERIYDGLITTREILNEWQLDAELVSLSACETALGKKVGGEGYIGFSHALFQVGAKSLLVSLWKVEDNATCRMMEYFYEYYFGSAGKDREEVSRIRMSKAEALQKAKMKLRDYTDENGEHPFEHPFFWAAFVLIGES